MKTRGIKISGRLGIKAKERRKDEILGNLLMPFDRHCMRNDAKVIVVNSIRQNRRTVRRIEKLLLRIKADLPYSMARPDLGPNRVRSGRRVRDIREEHPLV